MKTKIIIFLFFITSIVYGQNFGSISYTAPTNLEVGISTNIEIKYNLPPNNDLPSNYSYYKITNWTIDAYQLEGSDVPGYLNGSSFLYYNETNYNGLSDQLNWTIQVGGNNQGYENDYVTIFVTLDVSFYDNQNNFLDSNTISKDINFNVNRIEQPSISAPSEIFDCSDQPFNANANAGPNANKFNWSIIPGTGSAQITSGNGTQSITIKPSLRGSFSVKVVASRLQANPNYHKETTITINRKPREVEYKVVPITFPNTNYHYIPDYICKGSGREVIVKDDDNFTGLVWNAPNCTVNYLGNIDDFLHYEIVPHNNIPTGSQITVSVTAYYQGGCTADSDSKIFKIYDYEIPPTPDGYVYLTPISGNICEPDGFEVHYSTSYNNGRTSISQAVIPPHQGSNRYYNIIVTYYNYCSETSTQKSFQVAPPAPCDNGEDDSIHGGREQEHFIITPNPSNGIFELNFFENTSGTYCIYNLYGQIISEGDINNTMRQKIRIKSNTQQNIIFVYTKDYSEHQQLIINK